MAAQLSVLTHWLLYSGDTNNQIEAKVFSTLFDCCPISQMEGYTPIS